MKCMFLGGGGKIQNRGTNDKKGCEELFYPYFSLNL